MLKRCSGILLPVSSLPSKYGIGCFSKSAYEFVDKLKDAGQTYWQILPLGPTGYGDSPYQSFSSFSGNPYFISLDDFINDGLLSAEECEISDCSGLDIDYHHLYNTRYTLLFKAYKRSDIINKPQYIEFCSKNAQWLDDYALFMAVKEHFGGVSWDLWDDDIRTRTDSAIREYSELLKEQIEFQRFMQFHFSEQWDRLKTYANCNGIKIIGDIPIYAAFDSADVWSNPELFNLNDDRLPTAVAGCPPDGFSADGQLWGNPLYNWDYHKSTGYEWWINRLSHCFKIYDVVRVDHFRGFDEYYSIPYGDKTAVNGHWEKGPGMDLFNAVHKSLGNRDIIAEDLGFVTDSVRKLVSDSGFPNMKVLEFAFDSRDSGSSNDYLPHNYNKNCVAYTGTHDNQTIVSWLGTIKDEELSLVREYLCDYHTTVGELYIPLICLIMRSRADVCIIPMQDWLGLDDSARMNTPSTLGGNWQWRMNKTDFNDNLIDKIKRITRLYGR